jgi:hypothetical protein
MQALITAEIQLLCCTLLKVVLLWYQGCQSVASVVLGSSGLCSS